MPLINEEGAGAAPAGTAPAGHDSVADPRTDPQQPFVPSIAFDPYTRQYPIQPDGNHVPMSPVIHRAAHLMMPKGSLPSTPNNGIDVERIRRALPEQRLNVVQDELRLSWKPLIDENLLRIDNVELDPTDPWNGRFYSDVTDLTTMTSDRLPRT